MAMETTSEQREILNEILARLTPLDDESRLRIVQTVATFLNIKLAGASSPTNAAARSNSPPTAPSAPSFSGHEDASPKQFLIGKQPESDVERVVCLAYYLKHFRNVSEFNTLDVSKLNTEAAYPKFSNASVPVANASQMGYLVPISGGNKQLGAFGERLVQALPDREAAKAVKEQLRRRSKRPKRSAIGNEKE
ncbi:MAG: hypothetical protein HYY24_00230 [Verrucomicrobia bacterium]|nr:hypothetical protein [Verrucomicrobiota bacterium]